MDKMLRIFHANSRRVWLCLTRLLLAFAIILSLLLVFQLLPDNEKRKLVKHRMREIIDVSRWKENPTVGCGGNFQGYGEEFVRLRYARFSPKTKVFSVPCEQRFVPYYTFQHGFEGTALQSWHDSIQTYPPLLVTSLTLEKTTTIAIMRIEASNFYHTLCEWYNVFLLSKLLDFDASKVSILFLDDRPPSHMDETWITLFGNIVKFSDVNYNSAYMDLIWNVIGYESPMNFHFVQRIHFLGEFRDFFLNSFQLSETKILNCDKITVTVLLRRDYMTHPERKGGLVQRKFKNEDEILGEIKKVFDSAVINIVRLEQFSMKEQLKIITNTDVLIGMHGAGMTHVLFLPKHAAVFEMFPKYWGFYHSGFLFHYKAMARWRKLKYFRWTNRVPENESPDFRTRIPAAIVRMHCYAMKRYMCGT